MQLSQTANTDAIRLDKDTKTPTAYLNIEDINVSFGSFDVVKSLSMSLQQGEIGCLLGFSGCGKTTALRSIAGLETPTHGVIELNNRVLTNIHNHKVLKQVMPAKRGMGMVFQDYALFNHLNVSENIGFGLHRWRKNDRHERIKEMLDLIGLKDHAHKRISELSGGQQQRIALARALAPKPELLLLDEPFSNLDMMLRESLAAKVREILKATNTTAILVTHDQQEAFAIADKVGVMHQGKLAQWATPDELYHEPNSPFIAEFVGEGAMIDGVIDQGIIKTALGDIKRHPEPVHGRHCALDDEISFEQGEVCEYDFPNGTQIKVLVRPDDIIHDDHSRKRAVVTGRVFRGANFLYRLQLDNGEEVLSLVSSHHDHPIGSSIGYKPMLAHVVLFQGSGVDVTTWSRI